MMTWTFSNVQGHHVTMTIDNGLVANESPQLATILFHQLSARNPFSMQPSSTDTDLPMPIALPPSRHLSLPPTTFRGRTANQARVRGRFVSVPSTTRTSHQARRRLTATQRASLPDRERTFCEGFNVFAVEGDRADFIPINVNCGPLVEVLALVLPEKHSVSKRAVLRSARAHTCSSVR